MSNVIRAALATLLVSAPVQAAESLSGELRWAGQTRLSFPVSGVVSEVPAKPGMQVAAGEVLARLDARTFETRRQRAQALLDIGAPVLAEARRELETAADLHARTVISDYELRDAELAFEAADATHRRNLAELELAALALAQSELRAPRPAIVLTVSVQPGELVVSRFRAQPHVTIAMAGQMEVYVPVSVTTFLAVRLGDPARVSIDKQEYAAEVVALTLPSAEQPGAAFVLRFVHPPQERFFPGTAVGVELP